jgi:hypothetical protein
VTVMTDNAKLYRLMCELAADADRRGLVRPVCEPGEVMIYDDFGNVVGKARVDDDGISGHLVLPVPAGLSPHVADSPTVVDAPE